MNRCSLGRSLAQNLKDQPSSVSTLGQAKLACETRDESRSSGLAMGLFSAGFPTGDQGHLPHLSLRTGSCFPFGSATQLVFPDLARPPQKLHCCLNNFLRLSLLTQNCKPYVLTFEQGMLA